MSITLSPSCPLEQEFVKILICSPNEPIRKVTVKICGKIRALQILWDNSPKAFIYNGQELIESMTFCFYDIKENDSIIAIPKKDVNNNIEKWKKLTINHLDLTDIIAAMTNIEMSREIARIKDLGWNRVEKKLHIFHKLKKAIDDENFKDYKFLNKNHYNKSNQERNDQLVLESNLFAPSEDALPILW